MAVDYSREQTGSVAPGAVGFSQESGRAVLKYWVDTNDLDDTIQDAIGSTDSGTDGRLVRDLPRAHPFYPNMFVVNIPEIRGHGKPTETPADADLEAPAIPAYNDYPEWLVTVEFAPRPYAVLSDASIATSNLTWYKEDGSIVSKIYANEWLRYTDFDDEGEATLITAQQGQMTLQKLGGGNPNGFPFAGTPRLTMPGGIIRFRWFQVPYRYISSINSYIKKYRGYVNQNDWYNWRAGTLLFQNYKQKRYTPPFPDLVFDTGAAAFSIEKLVDIEFEFHVREVSAVSPPVPTNQNYKVNGHNAQPWLKDRQFYYSTSGGPNDPPTYFSFPFELLFTDPDV